MSGICLSTEALFIIKDYNNEKYLKFSIIALLSQQKGLLDSIKFQKQVLETSKIKYKSLMFPYL